ncbi:MAG TPA: hypothetical protein DD490_30675 [Acidobacteria bacterium]|nr:hypothetical protein [Acidobacteriota bacterium]
MSEDPPTLKPHGLTAEDVLVGCVVPNDPRALAQALRLVQSLRWFGGAFAAAEVLVGVAGGVDDGARKAFEAQGVRLQSRRPGLGTHLPALFPELWETGRDMLLLLASDTVVVQDPLPWMRRGGVQARSAPLPTVNPEVFAQLSRHFGLPEPPQGDLFAGTPTIPFCDAGTLLLPATLARRVFPLWGEYTHRLAAKPGLLHPWENRVHQASLHLALSAAGAPFEEAPPELHLQVSPSHVQPPQGSFLVDPAILRVGDHSDAEGYLLHCPYPFPQVRIEACNRRLRQEREGRLVAPLPIRDSGSPAAPVTQVAVLGMHRSGTSVLTALLRLLGLWTGDEGDFPPADTHNEEGYWEHRGVWSVDEAILQTLGAGWIEVADLDLSRLDEGLRNRLAGRALEVVRSLDRGGSWVIKDPRLCLLYPFWREILTRPTCIFIYRDPLPVARSLAVRDGFPIPFGIALWEAYTRAALAATRGVPRVLVFHRDLMTDPVSTLHRLRGDLMRLGDPGLAHLRVPAAEEIQAVFKPSLVHHREEPESEHSYLTLSQLALRDALATGSAFDLDPVPPLSAGARDLLAAYQSLRQRKVEADLHSALAWLDELDTQVSTLLGSRSWKIGRAWTAATGRFLGRPQSEDAERIGRLIDRVRSWRRQSRGGA